MNATPTFPSAEVTDLTNTLNRTMKLAIDSGEVGSVAEAQRLFEGYRLGVVVGPETADSATHQATLLTIVNTARRCFLGGVDVAGCPDAPLRVPWKKCQSLREAVESLQGNIVPSVSFPSPLIVLGDAQCQLAYSGGFAVQATWNGWRGGVTPLSHHKRLPECQECTPAGVLAGALAVSEAFQFVRQTNLQAGKRSVGMSLWRPDQNVDWFADTENGPELEWLPQKLWLVGLGHLGQAYLWTLGFLPYANPMSVELVLQDFDILTIANDSTSPLTDATMIGRKKARAMADWCEERGFRSSIQERRFDANFYVAPDEPSILLCGVDNATARAALDEVGFAKVIEAGLGKGTEEYLGFQLHTFPATKTARQHWGDGDIATSTDASISLPAYQHIAMEGMDDCGLTQLAGRSVGASFVGTATSALVVAELLRISIGAHQHEVIDGTLRNLTHRRTFASSMTNALGNPGVTAANML